MIAVGSCGHNCDDERIYHKQINTLIAEGYQVKYFSYCKKTYLDDKCNDNIEYHFYNSTEISQKQYKSILFNLLKKDPPKIFHIHDMELLSVAAKLKKQYPHIKIIYDVHEDLEAMWDTFSSYNGVMKSIINYMFTQYEKQFLPYVDYFILANQLARTDKYQKHADVKIIENFPLICNTTKNKKNQTPHKLIYHGQLDYNRGIITLIDAFNILIKKHVNLQLHLIGASRTKKFHKELIRKVNKNPNIQLTDQITHKKIWQHLYDAHIGVIPFHDKSIFQYNTPTKLFEYMIANCAIVSTNLPPIRTFCEHSANWANPGDVYSLVENIQSYLIDNRTYIEHITINNILIKKYYNWDNASQKLLNIYNGILN